MVMFFSRVCLCACESVTFESKLIDKVHIWYAGHLQNLQVKFLYKGRRVKVKITAAKIFFLALHIKLST